GSRQTLHGFRGRGAFLRNAGEKALEGVDLQPVQQGLGVLEGAVAILDRFPDAASPGEDRIVVEATDVFLEGGIVVCAVTKVDAHGSAPKDCRLRLHIRRTAPK